MRLNYKHALRAKGIKPIPPHHKLRSYRGEGECITASERERAGPKAVRTAGVWFENCRFEQGILPISTPFSDTILNPGPEVQKTFEALVTETNPILRDLKWKGDL